MPSPNELANLITVLQNVVLALNAQSKVLATLAAKGTVTLPSAAISGGAGAPTGTFLSITGPDGQLYKIELLFPS